MAAPYDRSVIYDIWYNSKMIHRKITTWVNKGITTIGNIIDENGDILSIANIQSNWNITCDFLLHLSLKKRSNSSFTRKIGYFYIHFHKYLIYHIT